MYLGDAESQLSCRVDRHDPLDEVCNLQLQTVTETIIAAQMIFDNVTNEILITVDNTVVKRKNAAIDLRSRLAVHPCLS